MGCVLPRRIISFSGVILSRIFNREKVSSVIRMFACSSFVMPSTRDAVLTVSPIIVYSILRVEPMFPTTASPEWIPIPIRKGTSSISSLLSTSSIDTISIAECTADSACSTRTMGAPKKGEDSIPDVFIECAFIF